MPQAIDLVIKNGASTPVDKTFVLMTPAAGDGASALWALREGTISKVFPTIEMSARKNASGDARKCVITLKIPSSYTVAANGLTAVGSSAVVNVTATIPADYPEDRKDDFAAFAKNLMMSPLVVACIRDGLSAT